MWPPLGCWMCWKRTTYHVFEWVSHLLKNQVFRSCGIWQVLDGCKLLPWGVGMICACFRYIVFPYVLVHVVFLTSFGLAAHSSVTLPVPSPALAQQALQCLACVCVYIWDFVDLGYVLQFPWESLLEHLAFIFVMLVVKVDVIIASRFEDDSSK